MTKHFFLIDDDEDELMIFNMALKKLSIQCKCTYASSSAHALDMLKFLEPDYIFIDINMPACSGMECLSKIRRLKRQNSTAIIMYSNGINELMVKLASREGAAACIRKTPDIDSLVNALQILLLKSGIITGQVSGAPVADQ